jgi:hypothetical protein
MCDAVFMVQDRKTGQVYRVFEKLIDAKRYCNVWYKQHGEIDPNIVIHQRMVMGTQETRWLTTT